MSEIEESGSESEVTEMVVGTVVNVGNEIDVGTDVGKLTEIEGTLVDYKKPQDVSGAFIEKCAKKRTRETLADAEPAVVVSIDTAVGVPAGELADDAEPESVGSCEAGAELEAALLGSVTDADASVPELAALVAVDVGDPPPLVSVACRLQ